MVTYITNQLILRSALNSVNTRINLNKLFHIPSLQLSYHIYLMLNALGLFPYFSCNIHMSEGVSRKTADLHSKIQNTFL